MPSSNGGTATPLGLVLYPTTGSMYTLDPANFNDPNSGSFYVYKVEDVIAGRVPTISRVIISYNDFGPCLITMTLRGNNDAGAIVFTSATVTIGTANASTLIITSIFGMSLTAQNLTFSIARAPNAGTVLITKVRLEGRLENQAYA